MKTILTLTTLFSILFLISCNNTSSSNSNKIIETYKQTGECLLGDWEIEDKSENNIHFKFTADINGDEFDNRKFTVEGFDKDGNIIDQASGIWYTKDVGQILAELNGGVISFSIKLTNCNRFVVKGKTIYIKK